MTTYWISFAANGECRGVVIIDAESSEEALIKCGRLRINPGGEALAIPLSENDGKVLANKYGKMRLINENELHANGEDTLSEYYAKRQARKLKAASVSSSVPTSPKEAQDGQSKDSELPDPPV